jgi:hypothetical protein
MHQSDQTGNHTSPETSLSFGLVNASKDKLGLVMVQHSQLLDLHIRCYLLEKKLRILNIGIKLQLQ